MPKLANVLSLFVHGLSHILCECMLAEPKYINMFTSVIYKFS